MALHPPPAQSSGAGDWPAGPEIAIAGAAVATIGRMHVCSDAAADYTLTLPPVAGNAGKMIGVRMDAGLTKLVALDANAEERIDGSATRILWAGESALLLCDGVQWCKVAGRGIPMAGALAMSAGQQFNSPADALVMFDRSLHLGAPAGFQTTATGRMTVLRAGRYRLSVCVLGKGSNLTAHILFVNLYRNGAQLVPGGVSASYTVGSGLASGHISMPVELAAGDYLQVFASYSHGNYPDSVFYPEAGAYGKYHHFSVEEVAPW